MGYDGMGWDGMAWHDLTGGRGVEVCVYDLRACAQVECTTRGGARSAGEQVQATWTSAVKKVK